MSEVTDFIAAVVAIAKDPDAWAKRLGDVKEAGQKLAEARVSQRQAEQAAKQAATDLETARNERGQAEHRYREQQSLEQSITRREAEVSKREKAIEDREARLQNDMAARNAEIERLEAAISAREEAAVAKFNEAQALMADYDEAKHKAALKLAS